MTLLNDISEAMATYSRQILENLVPTRELLCRFPYQRSQKLTQQKQDCPEQVFLVRKSLEVKVNEIESEANLHLLKERNKLQ